jgi:molybdate transport system substrate-binding protein
VRKASLVLLLMLGLLVPVCGQRAQIIVSAAASLTDVLTGLQPGAESFIGARVLFNFGGSGALRRQIEEGAPVDVFFSAAAEDMDRLEKQGLIVTSTRRDSLSNSIVLIGSASLSPVGADGLRALLASSEFLAIGNPDSVPAGRYAVQALTTFELLSTVDRKLVLGGSVREVLQYVLSGSAPLGIVFITDALSLKPGSPVRQLFVFPGDATKTPILYPVAVVSASRNRETARRMVEFFQGSAARQAFRSAGFIVKNE